MPELTDFQLRMRVKAKETRAKYKEMERLYDLNKRKQKAEKTAKLKPINRKIRSDRKQIVACQQRIRMLTHRIRENCVHRDGIIDGTWDDEMI